MTAGTTEAFFRVRIDTLLADAGWNLADGVSVLFEHALPDGSRADYVLLSSDLQSMANQGSNPLVAIQIALAGDAVNNLGE